MCSPSKQDSQNKNTSNIPQTQDNLLLSPKTHLPLRWFIGLGSGVNYSLAYDKPFALIDFKSGVTYDNEWGRSYIYANITYTHLQGWNEHAQTSQGYFLDTLINTDLGVNLYESPSFSFLLMFGVGLGGRWSEQSYKQIHSYYTHSSFFIAHLNIGARMEIKKEHVISLTLKPQLAKGWYENRQLTFEHFREVSILLSYTFWKF